MADEIPSEIPFPEYVKQTLEGLPKNNAHREQEPGDKMSDLVFETLEKYSTGKLSGLDAIKALRITSMNALTDHYLHGMQTQWPSILNTATQIAIAENAKK